MCRSMYVCMCNDVLSGGQGCERLHASAEQADLLTMSEKVLARVWSSVLQQEMGTVSRGPRRPSLL